MTIWISRELSLCIFERLDWLCSWIGHTGDKLWLLEFLESFHCSMSSVSKCDTPESDIRMKSYGHLKFFRAPVVNFRASRYIMVLNQTSVWKVMTIWISRGLPLFNFERLVKLCGRIWPTCKKLWPFEFLDSFRCSILSVSKCDALESHIRVKSYDHLNFSRASVVQFRASRYIMRLNRTSVWKVMTIWISRDLLLLNFERLEMWCVWIWPTRKTLWPVEFLESFRCVFSNISIGYAHQSDIRLKSYEHLNFLRASGVHFRASRNVMRPNRTSEW